MSESLELDDPLISIITPSFNQGAYLERTIQSVLRQDCARVQHIVVDGGSTDGTLAILKRYPHVIWVSEKDAGQADALNKGLGMARGGIIGWINSDDYYQDNIFGSVVSLFGLTDAQWLVGNQADVFDAGDPLFRKSPTITLNALLRDPDIVRQQATFFRRKALITAGGWNLDRHMTMDFDLWVRLARTSPPRMVDEDWAFFRNHAAQKSGHGNILRQAGEISAILRREKAAARLIARHRVKKSWYWIKGVAKERMISLRIVPHRYRNRPIRSK